MSKEDIEKDIISIQVEYINYNYHKEFGFIKVNRLIKEQTKSVFNELFKIGFPINKIDYSYNYDDEYIIDKNITTGYNFRYVSGKNKLSKHAFGMAIDLNPKVNPSKPSIISHIYDYDSQIGKIDKNIVDIFKSYGFKWGGEIFSNFYDPHHFEF